MIQLVIVSCVRETQTHTSTTFICPERGRKSGLPLPESPFSNTPQSRESHLYRLAPAANPTNGPLFRLRPNCQTHRFISQSTGDSTPSSGVDLEIKSFIFFFEIEALLLLQIFVEASPTIWSIKCLSPTQNGLSNARAGHPHSYRCELISSSLPQTSLYLLFRAGKWFTFAPFHINSDILSRDSSSLKISIHFEEIFLLLIIK